MNSITSKGLNALAQALCQYAELTMALFKKKALCLFENKILAHGQRSVYTHWTSLSFCYGIPFTRPLKQSSEEVLNASFEYTQKQEADVKMAQPYIFIWLLSEIHSKDFVNQLSQLESSADTRCFSPQMSPPESCGNHRFLLWNFWCSDFLCLQLHLYLWWKV